MTLQNDFGFNALTLTADSISAQKSGLFIFTPHMDITSRYRFETVPEPATLSLLAIGGVMLLKRRRA
ncbi:MAG: PEP-CTERM sorting domain-containing protein [Planctomycetota bacterium]